MTSADRRLVFVALALCVIARVAFLVLPTTTLSTKAVASIPDASEYTVLAENLAHHHVFSRSIEPPFRPEVLRTPGYPLFLAPFYLVFGNPLVPVLIAHIVLSLLLVLAAYKFCLELTSSVRTSAIAALLVAVSPNIAFISTKLVTETLFTLVLVVAIMLFNRFRVFRRTRDLAACGICCGVLALIRPIAMFLPLLLALLVLAGKSGTVPGRLEAGRNQGQSRFSHTKRGPRSWAAALLLLASFAFVVSPWVIRNATLTGRWILTTAGEHNLFLYNAATVVAAENNVSLVEARDMMREEAAARFGPVDTLDEARFWNKLSPIAWRHVLRRPWLAAKVQIVGFFSTLLSPVSLRPLAVHSGASPSQESNVAQKALALLASGRFGQAFHTLWQGRLAGLGVFGVIVFLLALVFELGLLVFAAIGLLKELVKRTRCRKAVTSGSGSNPSTSFPVLWLLWPILYFTLLTGALGEARMRVPVEPLLAILAAVGLNRLHKPNRAEIRKQIPETRDVSGSF